MEKEKLNEKIKRLANKTFRKVKRIETVYHNHKYEITFHKAWFWWQNKFSIRGYIKNIYTNHWEVKYICKSGSKIYCLGNGSGIIYGFFPRRKMKKQLLASARYWERFVKEE